jgi:hypothetical protein
VSEISKSALGESFDREFEAKVAACTNAEQIKELMHTRELERGLIKLDWDQSYRIPVETPQPAAISRSVVIAGQKFVIEGATETELAQNEANLYRKVFAQPAATAQTEEQPRNERGQFVSAEDAAAKAELELAFKRGDISASDYLQRSGAVAEYLEKQGVPVDTLREAVAEKQSQKFNQSWADATAEFLSHSDWPGSEPNRTRLGGIILELGLVDSPSVESLQRAYDHMKKNNLLVANPETDLANRVALARDPAELRQILNCRSDSSGLWGGR